MNAPGLRRFVFTSTVTLIAAWVGWLSASLSVAADPPSGLNPELIKKLRSKKSAPAKPEKPTAGAAAPKEGPPAKENEPDGENVSADPAAPKAEEAPADPQSQADPELLKKLRALRGRNTPKAAPPEGAPAKDAPRKRPVVRKLPPGQTVTFSKHVAPILWKNCASCHRPGEIGPFSLLNYEDASKRAEFIAEITASRRMPPWKPEPDFGKFHDARRLSDREIEVLGQWAESGAPEGNAVDLPKPPEFSEGWQLGEPDLVLKMAEPFAVPADGADIYRCFVIPIPLGKDAYVSGVEFRPGNRAVVHHAIMFLDSLKEGRKKDFQDDVPGFPSFGGPEIQPTGGLGGWAPGTVPRLLPEGIVTYVKKGSDLVLQVHYHPTGKEEADQSTVGVYFSKTPKGKAAKIVTGIAVLQMDLNIPANEARYGVDAASPPLPAEVEVLGVTPHMHYLGREMKVTATRPGSEAEEPLIWIKDWDFNWQGQYDFQKPIRLPRGSVIKVYAVYDNSAENPKNPNNPPQQVGWGLQSTDEMLLCSVQVVTDKTPDLRLVAAMPGNELAAGLGGGVPGQAAVARRQTTRKKSNSLADAIRAVAPAEENVARVKGNDPFGEDGIAIPEDKKKYFAKYDADGNGKITRKEVNKMSSPMQAYFVRTMIKGRGGN